MLLAATLEYTRIHLSNEFPVRLTNNSSYYTDNEGGNTLLHSSDYHKLFEEGNLEKYRALPLFNSELPTMCTSKEPHFGARAELAAYVDYSRPLVHDDAGS